MHLPAARPARPRLEPARPLHAVDAATAGAHAPGEQPGPGHLERDVDHHGAVQGAVREDAVQGRGLVHGPGEAVEHEAAAADVGRGQALGHQGHHEIVGDQLAALHRLLGSAAGR